VASPSSGVASSSSSPTPGKLRIWGLQWTYIPEWTHSNASGSTLQGVMLDYTNPPGTTMTPPALTDENGASGSPQVALYVDVVSSSAPGTPIASRGPYVNDAFSPTVQDPTGGTSPGPLEIDLGADPARTIRYRAKFNVAPAGTMPILLASPVLDDVTVFYDLGEPALLESSCVVVE
jgi:hypothetical protein